MGQNIGLLSVVIATKKKELKVGVVDEKELKGGSK